MKTAVVLFNLGGPDMPGAVRPFLYNLFSDPAIIRLPFGFRQMLASLIAFRRAKTARHIYEALGGASPILSKTQEQAEALQGVLGEGHKVFVCMRYWHPMANRVAAEVKAYAPDRIIALPLYPQFSTTTTASSFSAWKKALQRAGISAPMTCIGSYPTQTQFIEAHAELLRAAYKPGIRVLFSAHGLPEAVVKAGDPYPTQVGQTVSAIVQKFGIEKLDHVLCYQSRVGPLPWIAPYTEAEIRRAGAEGKSIVVVPVSFVSEHSETLFELDVEYAALAKKSGVKEYVRVSALGTHPLFIAALAALVREKTNA